MVLYTHDSPFIQCRQQAAKLMSAGEFAKLGERYRFGMTELTRFYKFFLKLQLDKGLDPAGLSLFLARFGNIDPSDRQMMRRLFEVTNTRGTATLNFEQCVALACLLQPLLVVKVASKDVGDAGGVVDLDRAMLTAKTNLFFDIIDTNGSGAICVREIHDLTHPQGGEGDRIEIHKERRKMMVNKMIHAVFSKLERDVHVGKVTRPELHACCAQVGEVSNFIAKGLFLAVNPWNHPA
jgi:hypothetical protein